MKRKKSKSTFPKNESWQEYLYIFFQTKVLVTYQEGKKNIDKFDYLNKWFFKHSEGSNF